MNIKPFYLAVRGILIDEEERMLLLKRSSESKNQPGYWEFPGGKVDKGESFSDALIREFEEETGLKISLEKVLGSGEWEREDYRIAYLFMLVKKVSGDIQISREHDEFSWMTKDELRQAEVSPQLVKFRDNIVNVKGDN